MNFGNFKSFTYKVCKIYYNEYFAKFALKRKFDDLKQVKNHTNLQLEESFKPITEPLHELVKENKKQNISNVKDSIKVKREKKQTKKYDERA